jgi:hypothetical protein
MSLETMLKTLTPEAAREEATTGNQKASRV